MSVVHGGGEDKRLLCQWVCPHGWDGCLSLRASLYRHVWMSVEGKGKKQVDRDGEAGAEDASLNTTKKQGTG